MPGFYAGNDLLFSFGKYKNNSFSGMWVFFIIVFIQHCVFMFYIENVRGGQLYSQPDMIMFPSLDEAEVMVDDAAPFIIIMEIHTHTNLTSCFLFMA